MRQQDMPLRVLRQLGKQVLFGALVVAWAGYGTAADAEAIPGRSDPDFHSAFENWLSDEEQDALPALSRLAHDGNGAARVLLGVIDKKSALQGPWVTALSRQDRISVLRAPGGLSGQNWMTIAAPDIAYAQLWSRLWHVDGGLDIAQGFAERGDTRAVREALLVIASRRESGFPAELLAAEWFPATLSYLAADWPALPDDLGTGDQGDPQLRMSGQYVDDADLRGWLGQSDLGAPLRNVCDQQCPSDPSECSLALYKGLGSYPALAMLGSPVPDLVSSDEFYQSPRGRTSLARRIMLTRSARMREADLARLGDVSTCAADWLRDEYGRYAYSLPTVPLSPQ
ncbi:hypothetical protein [Roseinatronobacter sp. S2]|uniref:hypothetical protein n=1 Tax=Roseinatronobacter sp. S2 TaxID=3035471 RepID=UPI00240FA1AC|nr:hypothetical protein [Roseinatronobacter sp. S2]WFE73230.1 hypothetical protein P8S53_08490 [Roseinatronobacter sp. S2]